MKKGDILQGTVYDTSFPNKGKIKIEDKTVSVKDFSKFFDIDYLRTLLEK